MDYESFTDGGALFHHKETFDPVPVEFTEKHMQFAVYKCAHTFKLFLRVVLIILIVWVAWEVFTYILDRVFGIKVKEMRSKFSEKEGLQYLGAGYPLRDDTGSPTIDLVAIADKERQDAVTAPHAAVPAVAPVAMQQKFTEHMVKSPEEKLMENIKKSAK